MGPTPGDKPSGVESWLAVGFWGSPFKNHMFSEPAVFDDAFYFNSCLPSPRRVRRRVRTARFLMRSGLSCRFRPGPGRNKLSIFILALGAAGHRVVDTVPVNVEDVFGVF